MLTATEPAAAVLLLAEAARMVVRVQVSPWASTITSRFAFRVLPLTAASVRELLITTAKEADPAILPLVAAAAVVKAIRPSSVSARTATLPPVLVSLAPDPVQAWVSVPVTITETAAPPATLLPKPAATARGTMISLA